MQPKDLPFPKYARDYFLQLLEQYELLINAQDLQAPQSIMDLIAKVSSKPEDTSWADVFALESAYLFAIPANQLRAEVQVQRNRYRDVAGTDIYNSYSASAQDLSAASEPDLRAELVTLGERIRYLYTFVPPKESIRNRLSMHTAWWTLCAIGIAVVLFLIYGAVRAAVPTILVVMFAGILGGFVSVQQRLQSPTGTVDPLLKELELSAGWFSVTVVSPLSGGIFAVVVYLLFVSGLASGGFFPAFGSSPSAQSAVSSPSPAPSAVVAPLQGRSKAPSVIGKRAPITRVVTKNTGSGALSSTVRVAAATTPTPAPTSTPSPSPSPRGIGFAQFTSQSAPLTPADYAKLLVWAFIAGFAERLVPDVLTRLTGQFGSGTAGPPATPSPPSRQPASTVASLKKEDNANELPA